MLSRTLLLTFSLGLNVNFIKSVGAHSSRSNTCDASIGTAKDKSSDLWSKIMGTLYDPINDPVPDADLAVAANPFKTKHVFTDCGDTMQDERQKSIHKRGVVFAAEYVAIPNSFGYTGIFEKGNAYAIGRFSYAVPPEVDDGDISVLPGFAMKFLLNNEPSVNLIAMHSLAPQNTFNLFANSMSNSLPELPSIPLKFAAQSFRIAKYLAHEKLFVSPKDTNPLFLTLDPLAQALNDGKKDYVAPNAVILVASDEIKDVYNTAGFDIDTTDFRVVLNGKGKKKKVFDVYAEKVDQSSKIGEIRATSDFVASTFGDQDLFFVHPL
eukprot:77872_1